jgi:glycosyltransferase involved in cell wall biosynthesis
MTADMVGGVWGYARDLCRAIAGAGGEVALVTMGPRGRPGLEAELVSVPGVTLLMTDYKLEWMDDASADVARAGELLLAIEREFRPDLVHLNGYAHGALPFAAPKLVVAHSCVLSWWRAVHGGDAPARYDLYRAQVKEGLESADMVVAPSAAMLSALRECYGARFSARVIHNGSCLYPHGPWAARDGVCSAGRLWDQAKNVELLLRAAQGLGWRVELAGASLAPASVRDAPPRLLPGNVTLRGHLSASALVELFARCAVYVHPARYEPFGLCVLEAARAGCALVLADIPSLRELWRGAALFVDPEDSAGLRAILTALRDDRRRREGLSGRALERAGHYSFDTFGQRYLDLYRALTQGTAPSSGPTHEPVTTVHREEDQCASSASIIR